MPGAVTDRTIDHCSLRVEGRIWAGQGQLQRGVMLVNGERVEWIGNESDAPATKARCICCASDEFVVPGFVDLHVHGGAGHDVVDGTEVALAEVLRVHARHGTTACCPTVTSADTSRMLVALEQIRRAVGAPVAGRSASWGPTWRGRSSMRLMRVLSRVSSCACPIQC